MTLSTDPMAETYVDDDVQVAFTVSLKISTLGLAGLNRWEKNTFYRKTANRLETLLDADAISQGYGIEYSKPVKYVPKVGSYDSRLLINGNISQVKATFPKVYADNTDYLNTGVLLNGNVLNNGNRNPKVEIDALAVVLDTNFDTFITTLNILDDFADPVLSVYWIDVCGVRYGYHGRSIQ